MLTPERKREILIRCSSELRERADRAVSSGYWQYGYYLIAKADDPEIIIHAVPYTAGPVRA